MTEVSKLPVDLHNHDVPDAGKTASGSAGRLGSETVVTALLLLPLIVILVGVIVLPSIQLFGISLTNYSPGEEWNFVGLKNYANLLQNSAFLSATWRSILYVVVVVSLEILIGFCVALLLQQPIPLRPLWMALVLAPYAVSPIVAVVIWKFLLDPSFGVVNYGLNSVGIPSVPWMSTPFTSMAAIVIASVWRDFGFSTIVLYAALSTIPTELSEAAKVDGGTPLQILFRIKIPLIAPAIFIIVLFRVIYTFREFATIWTFTGGGPGTSTEILSIYLYKEAFRYLNFGRGAATGWMMLLITLAISVFLVRRTTRNLFSEKDTD